MNHTPHPPMPRGSPFPAPKSPAENAAGPRRAPSGHILLVDDDSDIRGVIAALLRRAGYRVDALGDAGAGLIALCFNPYDLLITEHEMPNLTGLELLRRIRACPLSLPAIMISGFIPWEEADLDRVLRPGAVLEKPFPFASLLAKVQRLLHGNPADPPIATRDSPARAFAEASGRPRSGWSTTPSRSPTRQPPQGAPLPGLA